MKLVSYRDRRTDSFGVVAGGGVIDAGRRLGERFGSLRAVLAAGALGEIGTATAGRAPDVGLDEVELVPPIPDPGKILCVGLNYKTHIQETGRSDSEHPSIFVRFPESLVGHDRSLVKPRVSEQFDYEGELAVVIGRPGWHIPPTEALGHVAGYACFNDGSIRDWQRHTSQWTPGKNFRASGACGPWLTTADEVPDPTRLTLVTRLNGQEMQRATTDLLIFTIPVILAYVSSFTPLAPGDVIATGTPGGVGSRRTPPVFMHKGDTIEVDISGIGVLRNPIEEE
ncbi:MAG TPA: fumarylacetoacetate hydrolase family protein [Methylomirabilota bacterium]|jgi:2-keto-4-pentenoate hydratase/2-oxohepta-3-ene-1,7-dioic acid hydratase in catechol pathway|nr:fumarylacetoacetate hydrolase family protein [Methylomirabilota bacterium]